MGFKPLAGSQDMQNSTIEPVELRAPRVDLSIVLASIAINTLALALPIALLQVFDRVVPNKSTETLTVLFLSLIIALGLDFILKICRIILLGQASERYEIRLSDQVFAQMLYADSHSFSDTKSGAHVDRIAAIGQLRDYFGGQGRLLAIDLPFTVVFLAMIALIGGPLVIVPLTGLAILLVVSQVFRRLQRPALDARQSIDSRRHSFIVETLGQAQSVKSLAVEAQMSRRFEMLQVQSSEATRRLSLVSGFSQTFGAVFGQLAVAALAGFGGYLVIKGQIGIAELAACMLLNGRTIQPILKILSLWVQVEGVRSAHKKLLEVQELKIAMPAIGSTDIKGHIKAENVGLELTATKRVLFENLSFEVRAGECIAIDGDDGSGKSSLLRILLGEQQPTRGSVRIDGIDPVQLVGARGPEQLSYVDRDPPTFNGTLLENLSMFGDKKARDRAIEAARTIGLETEINKLPLGFDTPVIPTSAEFAANGLIQRIAIARVLARNPKILMFNEANTALDFGADSQLLSVLRRLRGKTTLILVSRRPSFIDLADTKINLTDYIPHAATMRAWEKDAEADRPPSALDKVPA